MSHVCEGKELCSQSSHTLIDRTTSLLLSYFSLFFIPLRPLTTESYGFLFCLHSEFPWEGSYSHPIPPSRSSHLRYISSQCQTSSLVLELDLNCAPSTDGSSHRLGYSAVC
ncbi:unnamed protein product [Citrullus colocynthis]|uniref:Uncharacterized protein n=1 Tax=Citrullus colocynthis TaxID=252529 RepID=A0ABP0YDX6_9ROSI